MEAVNWTLKEDAVYWKEECKGNLGIHTFVEKGRGGDIEKHCPKCSGEGYTLTKVEVEAILGLMCECKNVAEVHECKTICVESIEYASAKAQVSLYNNIVEMLKVGKPVFMNQGIRGANVDGVYTAQKIRYEQAQETLESYLYDGEIKSKRG